ncbi:hypothetical protein LTR87_017478 [Friedmanniomyces endolithicus]|nr:hypothetical protein LTS09_006309 [Friedmanniomyces endolithicus]KAK0859869.1 hypothetical protein LTR87_017478 [Friedmanniomyces endolithicus]
MATRSGGGYIETIPNLWFSTCLNDLEGNPATPCIAYCRPEQPDCLTAAGSITKTCSPSWSSYFAVKWSSTSPGPGWSTITSTDGQDGGPSTETVSVWTSFSKANYSLVVGISTMSTLTPVYAIGSPVLSITTTSYEERHGTLTYLSGPTPTCRYTAVATSTDCGQCTLTGGTVQLFYWPPTTTTHPTVENETSRSGSIAPYTALLNGTTLYSPSVYISFESVYASNNCFQVGSRHISTLLAMDSQDVSTQVHIGGKVGQYGANSYSALRYGDLTGLPPASEYELQPSCLMLGCPTIYPSSWNPVLAVPRQLRSMDSAWQGCAMGLEGLYDPPVALTPQAALPSITTPVSVGYSMSTAVPGSMQNTGVPMATSLSAETTTGSRTLSVLDSAAATTTAVGETSATATASLSYMPIETAASSRSVNIAGGSVNTLSLPASGTTFPTTATVTIPASSNARLLSAVGVIVSSIELSESSLDPARTEATGQSTASISKQATAGVAASSQVTEASVLLSEIEPLVTISNTGGQSGRESIGSVPGAQSQTATSIFTVTTVNEPQDPDDAGATGSAARSQPHFTASTTSSVPNGDDPSTAGSRTHSGGSEVSSVRASVPITGNLPLSSSYSAVRSAGPSATILQGNTTTALPVWAGAYTSIQSSAATRSTEAIGSQSLTSNSIAPTTSPPSSACRSVDGQLAGVLAAFAAVFWVVQRGQT